MRAAVLELGCGIGLVTLDAAQASFRVLTTDYYSDALEFTRANVERNGLDQVDTRIIDRHGIPDDLGTFDVVAAADVLYEKQQPAVIATALDHALSATGRGLVTDPGRRSAAVLIDECGARRLTTTCIDRVPMADAGMRLTASLYEVRRG
jgi:2-polyprenyl-3-methyl-5-hydroxy-6-metoxy-1,4-benzoquinol methylase